MTTLSVLVSHCQQSNAFVIPASSRPKSSTSSALPAYYGDENVAVRDRTYPQERIASSFPEERFDAAPLAVYNNNNDRHINQGRSNGAPLSRYYNTNNNWNMNPANGWWNSNELNQQFGGMSTIQGTSRRTFNSGSYNNYVGNMQVTLQSPGGRPLDTTVELWEGPNNTPNKMRLWAEDGSRPMHINFATPYGGGVMNVQNTGPIEFPMAAGVSTNNNAMMMRRSSAGPVSTQRVQGQSLKTFSFEPGVDSVQVKLESEGMPIKAVIELWSGHGSARQVAEIDSQDGYSRPVTAIVENPNPGYGNTVIAVRNTATIEFPLIASVEPLTSSYGYGGYGGGMMNNRYNNYNNNYVLPL